MAVLQRCWSVFVSSVFDDGRPGGKIDARVFLRIFFEEETLKMERERELTARVYNENLNRIDYL